MIQALQTNRVVSTIQSGNYLKH